MMDDGRAVSAPGRGVAGLGVFTVVMVALLLGLGCWQLQRRVEKHALIAALTERLAAPPAALPPPDRWSALTPAGDEFRRVSFAATFEPVPDAMVYSSGSAVRSDISGPGTWAFLPARLAGGGTVVVNAGFVQNTMQDRAQQDRAVTRLITGAQVELTGYLRFPESAGLLTPRENFEKRLWFARDTMAMARRRSHAAAARRGAKIRSHAPLCRLPAAAADSARRNRRALAPVAWPRRGRQNQIPWSRAANRPFDRAARPAPPRR
jgi:cytochrome oxidase assembly protein ShyY1